jgi:hypothetical protein
MIRRDPGSVDYVRIVMPTEVEASFTSLLTGNWCKWDFSTSVEMTRLTIRIIPQRRREPAFHMMDFHALAVGVVVYLVAVDLAEAEIA